MHSATVLLSIAADPAAAAAAAAPLPAPHANPTC